MVSSAAEDTLTGPPLSDITAVILAGGLGLRLRSAVRGVPKVLAPVRGRPFLTYLLEQLVAAGVRRVVLCTGHLADQVRSAIGDSYGDLRVFYSQESSPLGTGGALRLALSQIESDTTLVMNGDSFCDASLRDFWLWREAQGGDAALLLTSVPDTARYGRVHVDGDGQVLRFEEKTNGGGAGLINAGVYLMGRHLLSAIAPDVAVSLERDLFPVWIGRGLYGYRSEGRFLDIGTPETYAIVDEFFGTVAAASRLGRNDGTTG